MFFHRQIWLNIRTGDRHLWLHHKIEKQKTLVLVGSQKYKKDIGLIKVPSKICI
jgi:hypothetical protein